MLPPPLWPSSGRAWFITPISPSVPSWLLWFLYWHFPTMHFSCSRWHGENTSADVSVNENTPKIKRDTLSAAARPELHGQQPCLLCTFLVDLDTGRRCSGLVQLHSFSSHAACSGVRGRERERECCCVKRSIRGMKGRKRSSWNVWSATPSSFCRALVRTSKHCSSLRWPRHCASAVLFICLF